MLFPLLYALLSGPLVVAGLVCCWQCKPKTNKDLRRQFFLPFWQFTTPQ